MNNIKEYGNTENVLDSAVRSIDAETIVLQGEAERRKPLSLAEKRKRNETLAIGLSRTELLVSSSKESTTKDDHSVNQERNEKEDLIISSHDLLKENDKKINEAANSVIEI